MTREFLKNTGVPEDQIDKIMAEYGKDIQAEKEKAKTAQSELETYKAKVADLEKAAGDHEGVRKELDDLKAKIETERKEAEAKAADDQMTALIKSAFPQDRKFVNEYTEQAMIQQIKTELGKEENKGKGINEIFSSLTKDKAGIFENPNRPGDMPGFKGVEDDNILNDSMRAIMGLSAKKEK